MRTGVVIGLDKVIDWDLKRAASERADGRIDLFEIRQYADNEAMGLWVATIDGPMKRGEDYVKTGVIPPEYPRPVILRP